MRIKITGRNIELTEGLKAAVEDKLNKLEKYFTPDTDVYVTLSVEKERQKAEVTIPAKGNYIRSEQVSNDMYVSIDLVEEVIERQLKKYRTKLVTKQQNASAVFKQEFLDGAADEDEEIKIIRIQKMHVCRWNCWDMTSSYSSMQRRKMSMWYIREKATPTD